MWASRWRARTSPTTTAIRGCYPGTFDPPTVAHLAIASAALEQGGLDQLDLIVSVSPLGKSPAVPSFQHRLSVLEAVAATRPWLAVRVSEERLIAVLAGGYDAVVMGADKWLQVTDPSWYGGSVVAREGAVAALPRVLLAGRAGTSIAPPAGCLLLDLPDWVASVSSSATRAGRVEWMAPEAAEFDSVSGAWTDPARYLAIYGTE